MNWYLNYTYASVVWFSSYSYNWSDINTQSPATQLNYISTTQNPISIENVPPIEQRLPSINEEKCLDLQGLQAYKLRINTTQNKQDNFNKKVVKYLHRVALGAKANNRNEVYLKDRIWFCGGTLISDKFVLTTANCLRKLDRINITAEFVSLEVYGTLNGTEQTRNNIIRQIPHPLYNPPAIYHDIALVELERPAIYSSFVKPACLYVGEQTEVKSQLKTTGWQLAFFGTSFQKIQEANLHLVTTDECESTYKDFRSRLPNGIIEKVQICASEYPEDTCKSDPGSPLEYTVNDNNDETSFIVGIKSFGTTCNLNGFPGVYTRIAPYVPWIESIVRNNPQNSLTNELDINNITTTRIGNSPPISQLAGTVSERKCLSYREDIQTELKNRHLVTRPDLSLGAAGGVDATEGEFPHMAALGYSTTENISDIISWLCGGSLINEKFILTAAHCLNSRDLGLVKWAQMDYLTYTYKTLVNPEQVLYKIARRILHPLYKRPSVYHDIALLELDRPVEFNRLVRPACLYTNSYIDPNVTLIATGWGLTEYGEPSSRLQKVDLDIFNNIECNQAFEGFSTRRLVDGIVNDKQICAGKRKGIQDTCQGDSGGPLQFKTPGYELMSHVVGVVSFGKGGCGIEGAVGVYTRVAQYVPWIERIVWPDEYTPKPNGTQTDM